RIVERAKVGREALRFANPVEHERPRHDDEGRALRIAWRARFASRIEQREHLNRLAESHVVRETSAELKAAQKVEPAESFALVLAERADECCAWIGGTDAIERAKLVAR